MTDREPPRITARLARHERWLWCTLIMTHSHAPSSYTREGRYNMGTFQVVHDDEDALLGMFEREGIEVKWWGR